MVSSVKSKTKKNQCRGSPSLGVFSKAFMLFDAPALLTSVRLACEERLILLHVCLGYQLGRPLRTLDTNRVDSGTALHLWQSGNLCRPELEVFPFCEPNQAIS
jgi:hypothetical protein